MVQVAEQANMITFISSKIERSLTNIKKTKTKKKWTK